jgi:PAS domain S-box-containing protein
MNPAATKSTGYQLKDLQGRSLESLVSLKKIIPPTPIHNQESTFQRKDGTSFPVSYSILPIERDGSPIGSVLEFEDITERKKLAKDLQLKSDILENSLNAFDIVNSQGLFIYANQAYLRMWGYENIDEIIGTSPASHCADPNTPVRIIQKLKITGECDLELLARRKDGSTFDVHMWARLAHDSDGNEIYPTTSIDITERKKAENTLKDAIRTRDEFISICSHELKTPITSLKLQFQMAERQLKTKDPRVFAEDYVKKRIIMVNRQLKRMSDLIDEMLDASWIRTGGLNLKTEEVALDSLVHEVTNRFLEQYYIVGTLVERNIESPVKVRCDPYRIEQVVSNLITNSIKYAAGKPVLITLHTQDQKVLIKVKDQGMGIAKQDLHRIFHQFERAVTANSISGLGLGLYISKQIVEAHRGKIWVESEPEKGSTFVVELPLDH